MNTDTRLMILNDSDLKGCSRCDQPFPEDFHVNGAWYADISDDGLAEAECPECQEGNAAAECQTCGTIHPANTCREA